MDQNEIQVREQELMTLLSIVKEYILSRDEDLLIEFITHSEWGLAFEEIITAIFFYKIPISEEQYLHISKIGIKLEFSENDWTKIKPLMKN